MNELDYTTCAWCPRLCRHVCPVAVGASLESATPTALMSAPLLVEAGVWTTAEGVSATSLCLGCGACTAHCKVDVPVAARLAGWRSGRSAPPVASPLLGIEGEAEIVCVVDTRDWASDWAHGRAVARLRTSDDLGHAAWRAGSTAMLPQLSALFEGRRAVVVSGAVAEVLAAAGVSYERVASGEAGQLFRTCFEGATGGPSQLACCGRRENFPLSHPEAAASIAEENVRLLAGPAGCADQGCADWLRAHGGQVEGPVDALSLASLIRSNKMKSGES